MSVAVNIPPQIRRVTGCGFRKVRATLRLIRKMLVERMEKGQWRVVALRISM